MTTPQSVRARYVFIDTSAFCAAFNSNDGRHQQAAATFLDLSREQRRLFTSNLVVAETHALLLSRAGRRTSLAFLESVPGVVIYESEDDRRSVLNVLQAYADKAFSYTDALSFVLMERLELNIAFSFDDDFRQYGWDVIP